MFRDHQYHHVESWRHRKLSLSQNRLWGSHARFSTISTSTAFALYFMITTCMIVFITLSYSVHPNRLLRLFMPNRLEWLHANRAGLVKLCAIGGEWNPIFLRFCSGIVPRSWNPPDCLLGGVLVFSMLDPLLHWLLVNFLVLLHRDIRTISFRYWLRWTMMDRVLSANRELTLKCQSRCRLLRCLPSSVLGNRLPHWRHWSGFFWFKDAIKYGRRLRKLASNSYQIKGPMLTLE